MKYARNVKICSTITCYSEAKREVLQDFAVIVKHTNTHTHTLKHAATWMWCVPAKQWKMPNAMSARSVIRIGNIRAYRINVPKARGKGGVFFWNSPFLCAQSTNSKMVACLSAWVSSNVAYPFSQLWHWGTQMHFIILVIQLVAKFILNCVLPHCCHLFPLPTFFLWKVRKLFEQRWCCDPWRAGNALQSKFKY